MIGKNQDKGELKNLSSNNGEISHLKRENQLLRRSLQELSILNDIAVAINSSRSLEWILESIVQRGIKHMQVEQVAVILLDGKKGKKAFQTKVRGWGSQCDTISYQLGTQLTGWMLKNRKPLLIKDFEKDNRFYKSPGEISIHSLLGVPLLSKNRMIGLIVVFNKRTGCGFNNADRRLLSIIGSQSAQVIENSRLLEEEQELLKVQQELRLAYDIQTNLLPKEPPQIKGYEICGTSIPAKEVGGDYFDFISIDNHRIAFCLGDISGKAISAALLMSNLQATVRGQTLLSASAAECVERCNAILFHNTPPEKFATFFYGILDSKTHQVTYANAGHNYPFLFSIGKESQQLKEGDICLGCLDTFPFREQQLSFDVGDIFVLYSDGITEAINKHEEEFGEEGLRSVIDKNRNASARELTDKIISAVQQHAGECVQYDDMTLVIIKRKKSDRW